MRVAILVTHLLGTGHLKRASLLADGFARAGHDAIVLSGGFPAPNASPDLATLVQLSPIRSDETFSTLYGEDGEANAALFAQRRIEIGETLTGFAPDMLVTELFPFGRRKLAAEFESAIDAASGALIYASIRDILQYPRKEGRAEEAEARFAALYDGAFIHGDPALVPLEDSWDLPDALKAKVSYTGYITEQSPKFREDLGRSRPLSRTSRGRVREGAADSPQETTSPAESPPSQPSPSGQTIVAAGGGSVGDPLFQAAADAGDATWHLLVGGHDKDTRIANLRARGGTTTIEATRPDFQTLLAHADLAILQCGYNTAMDVVQSGVRTLFVPFEGKDETEQITRARAFATRFGCGLIRERDLTPASLRREADRMLTSPKPDFAGIGSEGILTTITLAEAAHRNRP